MEKKKVKSVTMCLRVVFSICFCLQSLSFLLNSVYQYFLELNIFSEIKTDFLVWGTFQVDLLHAVFKMFTLISLISFLCTIFVM